jgi:hypothetical protein
MYSIVPKNPNAAFSRPRCHVMSDVMSNHRKLEPKEIPCWLVGYGDYTKEWKMWDPATCKFFVIRGRLTRTY